MAESLAVRNRPTEFKDCCSQESVVKILEKQLESGDIKNCYLLTGGSGCGKTTIGRILASKINKGKGMPYEIDGASNNGVENVREIIKEAMERSMISEYKIFLIDECHMLTTAAWNAFLKCIEEPPKYSIFIFCTTDPQKIPATILNRVMRFNLHRIPANIIKERLDVISAKEGFTNYEETNDYISKICDGSLRTAISLLEKVSSYDTNLSMEATHFALGDFSSRNFFVILWYMIQHDEKKMLSQLSAYYNQGMDLKVFVDQFMDFVLDVLKYSIFHTLDVTKITKSDEEKLSKNFIFENCDKVYSRFVDTLLNLKNMIKYDVSPKSVIEVVFLQLTRKTEE